MFILLWLYTKAKLLRKTLPRGQWGWEDFLGVRVVCYPKILLMEWWKLCKGHRWYGWYADHKIVHSESLSIIGHRCHTMPLSDSCTAFEKDSSIYQLPVGTGRVETIIPMMLLVRRLYHLLLSVMILHLHEQCALYYSSWQIRTSPCDRLTVSWFLAQTRYYWRKLIWLCC